MHGLGETFAPDPHTGTGNLSIPLGLPPGRSGLQPELVLRYSTGAANGPFGLGWSLGVPSVSRKTAKGVPRYEDQDVFVLSGAEDLVALGPGTNGTRYRPRTEGLFSRIERVRGGGDDYWRVRSGNGLGNLYGTPGARGADPATVARPGRRTDVFEWELTQTTDSLGNCIVYDYEHDSGQDGARRWDQTYLRTIRYIDHGNPAAPQFLVSVVFVYESRPDPFGGHRSGFEIRTTRRCRRIEVRTHAGTDRLVRSYELDYLDDLAEAPANGVSLLTRIAVVGHDGTRQESMPPIVLDYSGFRASNPALLRIEGPDLPARSLAAADLALIDLLGNGLPDMVELSATPRYWRNLGHACFDRPRPLPQSPADLRLSDRGVQILDADGDGRPDLLVTTPQLNGYFPMRFGATWDPGSFRRAPAVPSFDLKARGVSLVDLTGDGVTNVVRSGTTLECFFHEGEGWTGARSVERRLGSGAPDADLGDPRVRWADMDGDGLQDLVLLHDGQIEFWPSCGYGEFGAPVVMAHSPRFPWGYNPGRILLGDLDGDGAADLVYVDDRQVTVWINHGGEGWSEPIVVPGTPTVTDLADVRIVDLLGTGVAGIFWTADAGGPESGRAYFLDLTAATKPYLLTGVDKSIGARTRIEYAPSIQYYVEDEQHPATRWRTSLPFPVHVVARVITEDDLSGGTLSSAYRYRHGYWDGCDREFRGFARVDQRDAEVFTGVGAPPHTHAPPIETRTWFHVGPVGDCADWQELDLSEEYWDEDPPALMRPPEVEALLASLPRRQRREAVRTLRGRALRIELYGLDGDQRAARPFTVTELQHGVREEEPPAPHDATRARVFFPYGAADRSTDWDRGHDPLTRLTFTDEHDRYGQPRAVTRIAVPRGRDFRTPSQPGAPYLASLSRTCFAQRDDATHYIVDRPARVTVTELLNDGSRSAADLHAAALAQVLGTRVTSDTLRFYDGDPFEGLASGSLGTHGALVREESLVLTPDLLANAYRSSDVLLTPPETPPYLTAAGAPVWSGDYPAEVRTALPASAGYVYRATPESTTGWYARTERRRYDWQEAPTGRGLVTIERDPLDHDTTTDYDEYGRLPRKVTGPAGLPTTCVNDYRVLEVSTLTDPNGNRTLYTYTPLGLLESVAVLGKGGESVGDTATAPSTRYVYDFGAYAARGQPISVRTIRRVYQATDTTVPEPRRSAVHQTVEYSDGLGRVLQTRAQAEDVTFGTSATGDAGLPADPAQGAGAAVGSAAAGAPRVVVSGTQVHDTKGRVVEQYEPALDRGWDYSPLPGGTAAAKATVDYDARGRITRTLRPGGLEELVVYGLPTDVAMPAQFEPTPWEQYRYDPNDSAGRTHAASSTGYQSHWNTPTSTLIDALGRVVTTTARNGTDATTRYRTQVAYNLRGDPTSVTDPLGRVTFTYVHDLLGRIWRVQSLDGGAQRTVIDAAGAPLETRDARGAFILRTYDTAHRPGSVWARDRAGEPVTCREVLRYGAATEPLTRAANQLGRLVRRYDEAGRETVEAYDHTGAVLRVTRQILSDATMLSTPAPAAANGWSVQVYRVDWRPPTGQALDTYAETLLDPTEYRSDFAYDALNRVTLHTLPHDVEGGRRQLHSHFDGAGNIDRLELDGATYVERIAYNARGQRVLIAYGNGIMTRLAYDPATLRLARMRTELFERPAGQPSTYRPAQPGRPLQDTTFGFDLAGNVLQTVERAPGAGVVANPDALSVADPQLRAAVAAGDALLRRFSYDPLYRLTSATGRECANIPSPRPWSDAPRCGNGFVRTGDPGADNAAHLTTGYSESYDYDPSGNLTTLTHRAGTTSWRRSFGMGGMTAQQWATQWTAHLGGQVWHSPPSNRLTHGNDSASAAYPTHAYDDSGNLITETTSRHFEWDRGGRMRSFRTQAPGARPSTVAYYLYDATGARVKELITSAGGGVRSTVYVGGSFEHLRVGTTTSNEIHVRDPGGTAALVRVGAAPPGDASPPVRYQVGDHLGSATLVIDASASAYSREEFSPYGATLVGGYAKKRYRFTGKKRDVNGFDYFGGRWYASWLARWSTCDPAASSTGASPYVYAADDPIGHVDPDGKNSVLASLLSTAEPLIGPGTGAVGGALARAAAQWGSAEVIAGGGGAAAAGASAPAWAWIIPVAAWAWAGYQWYGVYQSWQSLQQAKANSADLQRQVRQAAHTAWQNGAITDDEYFLFLATGTLVIQPRGSGSGAAAPPSTVTKAATDQRWWQLMQQGINYNRARRFDYPFREVYVNNPDGGYYVVDALDPGKEIVSRKNTQFAGISIETGIEYVKEAARKYAPGTPIADVPSNEGLLGIATKLEGQLILEIPLQRLPIPNAVLEMAKKLGVTIRDHFGNIYKSQSQQGSPK